MDEGETASTSCGDNISKSMIHSMRRKLILIALSVISMAGYAQFMSGSKPAIRTMRIRYLSEALEPSGNVQRPYLVLDESGIIDGSDETNTLEFSFDELSHDIKQYTYKVFHCDMNWLPSDISTYEYLDGFTTADITDHERSVNTQQEYTHYSFVFPNEDMQLKASGNYMIAVYQDGVDQENMVAIFCFQVVEPLVDVDVHVRANTDKEFNGRYQQLDIDINTAKIDLKETNDITLLVQQNGRMDNQQYIYKPTFVEPNRLRYVNNRDLIFEGGNEFRRFDSYSTYYAGYNVNRVAYEQGEYHILLEADRVRGTMAAGAGTEGLGYLTDVDANGQWVVNCEKTDYPDTDAEYMWVHFCLPVKQPMVTPIFVGGDLFNNNYTVDNMMQYDAENKCYYLYAYLKQGGYNYMYYTMDNRKMSLLPLEGSHWQTRNEYSVDVYFRPFGARYDRLVGKILYD
jgi:hypothetical protein